MTATKLAVPVVAVLALFPVAPAASAAVLPAASVATVTAPFATRCTTVPVPSRWRPTASAPSSSSASASASSVAVPSAVRAAAVGEPGPSRGSSAALARLCRAPGVRPTR